MIRVMHYNLDRFHTRWWNGHQKFKGSIAISMPSAEALLTACVCYVSRHKGTPTISFMAGKTHLHPKDKFNNKLGYLNAVSFMKLEEFKIDNINVTESSLNVELSKEGWPKFTLKMYYDSKLVRIFR